MGGHDTTPVFIHLSGGLTVFGEDRDNFRSQLVTFYDNGALRLNIICFHHHPRIPHLDIIYSALGGGGVIEEIQTY